jgi:hypothetical protein
MDLREMLNNKYTFAYVAWMDRNVRDRFGIGPVPLMCIGAFGVGFGLAWELCQHGILPIVSK